MRPGLAAGAQQNRGSFSAAPVSLKSEARFRFEKDVSVESAGILVRGDTRHSAE